MKNKETCVHNHTKKEMKFYGCEKDNSIIISTPDKKLEDFNNEVEAREYFKEPPFNTPDSSWKERFKNFYYETGEYTGRKLGIEEYESFIDDLLKEQERRIKIKTQEKDKEMILELIDNYIAHNSDLFKLRNYIEITY